MATLLRMPVFCYSDSLIEIFSSASQAAAFSFYGYLEGVISSWLSTSGGDWLHKEAEAMARMFIQGLRKANLNSRLRAES